MKKRHTEKKSRVTRKGSKSTENQSGASAENLRPNRSSSGRSRRSSFNTEQTSVSTRKRKRDESENKSPVKKSILEDLIDIGSTVRKKNIIPGKKVDDFCWICHKKADEFYCGDCPRVYHNICLKKAKTISKDVTCECKLKTIDGLNPLPCNKSDLRELLLYALDKVVEDKKNKKDTTAICPYVQMFRNWPDVPENQYLCYIVDIGQFLDRTHHNAYDSTGQFFQDVKWVYHNCCIMKGTENEMTLTALKFERAIKQQLADAEACPDCYLQKIAKYPSIDFFTRVCENPHVPVWAKMKGFPYWPAKCLRIVCGHADVRFFGTHDKALVQLSQVYKISHENPGGNPKKPKNSVRMTSYEEAIVELSIYISNLKDKLPSFDYCSEKTPYTTTKTPQRRLRQTRNTNQLEDSRNSEVNDSFLFSETIGETSRDISGYNELSGNQDPPQLNVSVLNDDSAETKVSILQSSSVALEKCSKKSNESVAFYQLSFAEDEDNAGETTVANEVTEESPESHSQLLELSLNSMESSPEYCVNVPSTQVLLNNIETAQGDNCIYTTSSDESPAISSAPCVITSTHSLNSSYPDGEIPDAANVNTRGSSSDEHMNVLQSISEVLPQILPVDENEIQVVQERHHRKTLVEGVTKNKPLTKTLCQLLLGNKPSIRNHISSFQNLALRFYLMMWLEVNSAKLDMNECKMFHSIYEKLYKSIETYKAKNILLQKENTELKEKLSNYATGEDRKKEILNVVVEAQKNNNSAKIRQMKKEIQKLSEDLKEAKTTVAIHQELREELKSKIKDLQSLLKEKGDELLDNKKTIEDLENRLFLKNQIISVECQTDNVPSNSEQFSDNIVVKGNSSIQLETSARFLNQAVYNPNYTIEVIGAPNSLLTSSNMFEGTTGNIILPSSFIEQPAQLSPPLMAQTSSSCFMKNETYSESFASHSSKSKSSNCTYKQSSNSIKSNSEVISMTKKTYSKSGIKKRK